ncbi:hypothetical protein DPX16_21088 [Anabarilius grahami]|uniref:Uncharacterized protein n=1 Tax=Anabarilius grahami TaxID=495550 RepID=A0A3N0ZA06_ANAGA|nr:hypothetical protein DPX16_21088 [Anabarilius grahami]
MSGAVTSGRSQQACRLGKEMEGEDLKWEWGENRRAPVDVGDSGSKGKPLGLESICSWLNSALAGTATNFAFDFQLC